MRAVWLGESVGEQKAKVMGVSMIKALCVHVWKQEK
jgi:hypothetical protein